MAIRLLAFLCLTAGAYSAQAYTTVRKLELDATGFDFLRIQSGRGDMVLSGGAGPNVEVELVLEFDSGWSEEEAEELLAEALVFDLFDDRGELRLDAYFDQEDSSRWQLGGFLRGVLSTGGEDLPRLHLEVSVPASLDLEVHDGSGDVRMSGLGGSLAVHDGSGDIDLRDAGGDVVIHDGSGELELRSVAGALTIHDGSGDIRAEDVGGFLEVHDGSGDIWLSGVDAGAEIHDASGGLRLEKLGGDVDIMDGSGDIEVREVGGSLTVRDGSGDIDVDGVKGDAEITGGSGDVRTYGVEGRVRRG